jgi:hypothetical protein
LVPRRIRYAEVDGKLATTASCELRVKIGVGVSMVVPSDIIHVGGGSRLDQFIVQQTRSESDRPGSTRHESELPQLSRVLPGPGCRRDVIGELRLDLGRGQQIKWLNGPISSSRANVFLSSSATPKSFYGGATCGTGRRVPGDLVDLGYNTYPQHNRSGTFGPGGYKPQRAPYRSKVVFTSWRWDPFEVLEDTVEIRHDR